jgi:hypothetical protein
MPAHELVLSSPTPALDPLLERVRTLMSNAQGPLTRTGCRKDFERYQRFCSEHGLVAVPASEPTICLYLTFCSEHLRVATTARRLPAIAIATRL